MKPILCASLCTVEIVVEEQKHTPCLSWTCTTVWFVYNKSLLVPLHVESQWVKALNLGTTGPWGPSSWTTRYLSCVLENANSSGSETLAKFRSMTKGAKVNDFIQLRCLWVFDYILLVTSIATVDSTKKTLLCGPIMTNGSEPGSVRTLTTQTYRMSMQIHCNMFKLMREVYTWEGKNETQHLIYPFSQRFFTHRLSHIYFSPPDF